MTDLYIESQATSNLLGIILQTSKSSTFAAIKSTSLKNIFSNRRQADAAASFHELRNIHPLFAGILISICSLIDSVQSGTVYSCYVDKSAAPDPGYGMGAAVKAVNRAANCDDSASPGGINFITEFYSVAVSLSNSAKSGMHDTQRAMLSSFEQVTFGCTHGFGYWYYHGDDHTTGVINWKSSLEAYSPKSKRDVSSNSSPMTLEDIHTLFGGPPNNGTYYVPDYRVPAGAKLEDYPISLEDLHSILGSDTPMIRGRRAVRSSAVNAKSALSKLFSSQLAPRYEQTTCQALGSVIDNANGFRVFRISGVNWSGRFEQFASSAMDGLANRILSAIIHPIGYDGDEVTSRGIVASKSAMFLSAYTMGDTWRNRVSLITQSALNTLLFNVALNMSRNLYPEATYVIADGAGNVVMRFVLCARNRWVSAGDDS